MTVNRELRGGATQSPDVLNLARERSGGKKSTLPTAVPVNGPFKNILTSSGWIGKKSWTQLNGLIIFIAYASKRVVPRRGNPSSLY
ncbi:hypothetical protein UQ64_21550 [Paenibacillus etheri]|uniref:Uncharacterized protein n=1 Tax=Paenibacillus etheri TaxID=1306852 RepID=A0A0W1AV56_9BACL|nr:hypothetical protein UQ64_21550 [Paenibacillus etheri]